MGLFSNPEKEKRKAAEARAAKSRNEEYEKTKRAQEKADVERAKARVQSEKAQISRDKERAKNESEQTKAQLKNAEIEAKKQIELEKIKLEQEKFFMSLPIEEREKIIKQKEAEENRILEEQRRQEEVELKERKRQDEQIREERMRLEEIERVEKMKQEEKEKKDEKALIRIVAVVLPILLIAGIYFYYNDPKNVYEREQVKEKELVDLLISKSSPTYEKSLLTPYEVEISGDLSGYLKVVTGQYRIALISNNITKIDQISSAISVKFKVVKKLSDKIGNTNFSLSLTDENGIPIPMSEKFESSDGYTIADKLKSAYKNERGEIIIDFNKRGNPEELLKYLKTGTKFVVEGNGFE